MAVVILLVTCHCCLVPLWYSLNHILHSHKSSACENIMDKRMATMHLFSVHGG